MDVGGGYWVNAVKGWGQSAEGSNGGGNREALGVKR